MVSSLVLLLMILAVALGPLVWRVAINDIDFSAQLQGPSWNHPLGTDDLGQDVLARLLYGGRISLAVGLCAMLVAATVGVLVGAIAGMSRGSIDAALMWLADLFLSLPQFPLLLMIIYFFRIRQVVRHILPNALGPVIVAGTIDVAAAIITESTLSFLGLGFPPDIPSWGRMLFDAKDTLDVAPHWAMFSGAAIFITVLAINFVGDGLRDALDPRRVL